MLCFSFFAIYCVFTFHSPSNSNNNKSKYIILFLNASDKDRTARETSCYPALTCNWATYSHVLDLLTLQMAW